MIPPRERQVRPFELIRWARACADRYDLPGLEAHLLLVLATYANGDCQCWPGVRQLAADCRLRVVEPRGTCSTLSKALSALQERRLIWTKQGGRGRPAVRELLFDPDRETQPADDVLLSASAETKAPPPEGLLSAADASCSPPQRIAHEELPVQRPEQQEQPKGNGHMLLSADAESNSPAVTETNPNDPTLVREAIRRSLADASSTTSEATATLARSEEDEVAPAPTRRPDAGADRA